MQFSFERRPKTQTPATPGPSTTMGDSAADKLKKAIERNKMKMQKRQGSSAPMEAATAKSASQGVSSSSLSQRLQAAGLKSAPTQASMQRQNTPEGQTLLDKMRARREEASGKNIAPPPLPPQRPTSMAQAAPSASQIASQRASMDSQAQIQRRQVTDPSKIELAGELRRASTAPAVVDYSIAQTVKAPVKKSVSAKRKVKTKNHTQTLGVSSWLVKGSWCFCAFLIARLVFSDGGVIEYFDKKEVFNNKVREMEIVKVENELLMEELESIKDDGKYQKKLVRDHLGYIAKDEYLVLFPKNESRGLGSQDVSSI